MLQTERGPCPRVHGCCRCAGDDQWCVVAAWSDDEWRRLRAALGDPAWSRDPDLATPEGRVRRADEVDRHIEEWTSRQALEQVMETLQAAGVEVAKVQHMGDLADGDPHMAARGFYETFEHFTGVLVRIDGILYKLSRTPASARAGAPIQGIDNEYAYRELLGLGEAALADCAAPSSRPGL